MLGNEHNEYQAIYKCVQMYVSLPHANLAKQHLCFLALK